MKLYKIWQEENTGYDTFSDAVVCAKSEDDAKRIHPWDRDFLNENNWFSDVWASLPENVHAVYLGEARLDMTTPHVICASFHAG